MQGWRKTPWFLSTTKAGALQTLPVETRVALLNWRPKPCLSHSPTQIKSGNQRDWKNSRSATGLQGQKGPPHCTSSRTPNPHCCCGSQPPLAREAFETPHSKGSLSSPVQPEPLTPSLLQTEPLSSTEAASPQNFGWFSTSAGQRKNRAKREESQEKHLFFIKAAQTGYY